MTTYANITSIHPSTAAQPSTSTEARNASPKLRITRRGRIVFGALASVLVAGALALGAMLAAPGAIASDELSATEFSYVLAQTGDSLWSIAQELDPAADTRDVVAEISRLNQLSSAGLQAGEAIAVPLRFTESDRAFSASEVGL